MSPARSASRAQCPERTAVFILNGRCGSTLLQSLLYETGEFALYGEPPPGENAFVDALINRIGTIPDEEFERRLTEHYHGHDFSRARRVLSKLPNYAFVPDILDRIVPNLKVICLERSVVDVVRSLVAGDMVDHVHRHYLLGAPWLLSVLLEDYFVRSGERPADDPIALVGLYTAFRYRVAREALARLPAERCLRIEFVDWMDHFEERSREILCFVGLDGAYAEQWTKDRNRRVQHTGRSTERTSYHTSIAELPPETSGRLRRIVELYGLQDLPTAEAARAPRLEVSP